MHESTPNVNYVSNTIYYILFILYILPLLFPEMNSFVINKAFPYMNKHAFSYFNKIKIIYMYVKEILYNKIEKYILKIFDTDLRIKCKKMNKNKILIEYIINEKSYKLILNYRKTPTDILVKNENDENITSDFLSYLGPKNDFHNQKYTPLDIGFKIIKIYKNDEEYIFNENEQINI
jgi:hypothetical protein